MRWASNTPSFCSVRARKPSLHHTTAWVSMSNTIMGSGAKSILLDRAESMPPVKRSMYWRMLCCTERLRRRAMISSTTAAAPSPMASRTSKGMAARANSTRHMKYRVTLVRRILVSFLFKGVPSLRHTDPLYNS